MIEEIITRADRRSDRAGKLASMKATRLSSASEIAAELDRILGKARNAPRPAQSDHAGHEAFRSSLRLSMPQPGVHDTLLVDIDEHGGLRCSSAFCR